jgi:hypothetical protein
MRYVRSHRTWSRDDLFPPGPNIEVFLTELAVNRNVAAATQNQAMNALVFLTSLQRRSHMPSLGGDELGIGPVGRDQVGVAPAGDYPPAAEHDHAVG